MGEDPKKKGGGHIRRQHPLQTACLNKTRAYVCLFLSGLQNLQNIKNNLQFVIRKVYETDKLNFDIF